MKITVDDTVTPVMIVDDFLSEKMSAEILEECIGLQRVFRPATVLTYNTPSKTMHNTKIRKNEVVYIDNVFKDIEDRSKILDILIKKGIQGPIASKLWEQKHTSFEIINRCTRFETVLSRYGQTDFYDFHQDYNHFKPNRLITMVYYVNKTPQLFKGGNLILRGDVKNFEVEPKHNRLILFNSGAYHRVEKTELEDDKFENGRFSINMWVGFKT